MKVCLTSGRNSLKSCVSSVTGRSPAGLKRRLSGPLNRLNAILSLIHPLDRYRTPSAIGSAIGVALSRPISHARAGRSSQPPRSKPLKRLNSAIVAVVSKTPLKQSRNKNAIVAAILNRPRPRLNSQPQRATKKGNIQQENPRLKSFWPDIRVRKRGFFGTGFFQRSPFSRDSREFRDSRDCRDSREPQNVENKGKSDHFLEILENLEILEIQEIPPVKRPLS